ncbi:MAG TPA: response regulator, partial [Nitrospiria bacterium]|nr:response regulator [Nitrospiria bacterium]
MAKVLVVDDDSHFRGILERIILRSYTYSVKTAATEEEAWEELLRDPHDLVLLDLYIDGKKSWDTLRWTRALPSAPGIIVVSCEDTKENADYAKSLGAFAFVPKPIDFARFKSTVDAALGWRQDARSARRIGEAAGKIGGVEVMRVLIVASDAAHRRGIADPLERAGFQAIEREDARTALETIRKEPVDAILVGFQGDRDRPAETCRTIRHGATESRRLPLIAVTDPAPETILLSLKAGADDYLVVPFDPRILA